MTDTSWQIYTSRASCRCATDAHTQKNWASAATPAHCRLAPRPAAPAAAAHATAHGRAAPQPAEGAAPRAAPGAACRLTPAFACRRRSCTATACASPATWRTGRACQLPPSTRRRVQRAFAQRSVRTSRVRRDARRLARLRALGARDLPAQRGRDGPEQDNGDAPSVRSPHAPCTRQAPAV